MTIEWLAHIVIASYYTVAVILVLDIFLLKL
jgi:hypothetical protein